MKKKVLPSILAITVLMMVAVTASAGSILENIQKKGVLRIGTSGQQPPMTATTKNGETIGLDIDIARKMADAMGVKVKFIVVPFPELLPALKADRVDMIISGMTMTAARNLEAAFAGPYFVSGKGILANGEKYTEIQKAEGLNSSEVTIAALANSTSQEFAESLLPKAKLVLADSYHEAVTMLLEKKIDALVADYPFCAFTAYRYQDKMLRAGKSPLTFEPLGIAMKEDALLINWVHNFLAILQGSGELKDMKTKWLQGGKWVAELP